MTAGFYFLVHRDGNVGRWIHHFGPDWMKNDLPGKLLQIFKVPRWRWSHPDFYCLTMGLIFAFHSEISQLLGGFEMKFGTFVHSCSPQETPGMDCNNWSPDFSSIVPTSSQIYFHNNADCINLQSKLKYFYTKTNSTQYLAQNIPYTCEQQRFHNNILPACQKCKMQILSHDLAVSRSYRKEH